MSRQAEYSRRESSEFAEIGPIPEITRGDLREACRLDLHKFLVECFPESTGQKPFGPGQVQAIQTIESVILHGGRVVQAFPRGYCKTDISLRAAIWAVTYGHRRFVPIIGASRTAASDVIDAIKKELSENDILHEMFPEICYPIRSLEGKPQRCASQTCGGKLTYVRWTADKIVLPTIEGSQASGSILMVRPMKSCRGMKHTTPDGKSLRPDFFLIDDPQTDETAASKDLCRKIINTIFKTVLLLGGHKVKLSGVVNCTVIEPDDAAEALLKHPSWQAIRYKMILAWSEAHESHWLGEYARLLTNYERGDKDGQLRARQAALKYYKKNRKVMDKGAQVAWEWGYAFADPEACEISAIQHAYNMLIELGPDAFASECQNEPPKVDDGSSELLSLEQICGKANGIERRVVPSWAQHVVGFVDPNKPLLYYGILAAGEGFRASLIDWGAWPEQKKLRFAMRDARPNIEDLYKGKFDESMLRRALEDLADAIDVEYHREDGAVIRMEWLLTDANWGQYTDVVYEWARASKHASILLPSHGTFVGAGSRDWNDRKPEEGEINGPHWRIPNIRKSKKPWRHIIFDTNWWKDFVHARLRAAVGAAGSIELFGGKPDRHVLLAEHLRAEKCNRMTSKLTGRTVNHWELPKNNPDNHIFDVVVGCCVAASRAGVRLDGQRARKQERKTVTFAEIKARRGR